MAKSKDKHVEQLQKQWARDIGARAEEEFLWRSDKVRAKCESPIEEMLAVSILYQIGDFIDNSSADDGGVHWMGAAYTWPDEAPTPFDGVFCFQQAKIGNYRADLLFVIRNRHNSKRLQCVVVECDGHDFHERTKEQAARDKARDRWMVSEGVTLLRYTGSEIWKNAQAAGEEVCGLISDLYYGKKK